MIADYSELVAEVAERTGYSGLAQRAAMLVGMAEVYLNKRLRVSDMESSASLTTDASGDATLPSDFLEVRAVYQGAILVQAQTLSSLKQNFRAGYAITGSTLHSSKVSASLTMDYYAALPGLAANSTNWLLTAQPNIYIFALMQQVYLLMLDEEKVAKTAIVLDSLIADLSRSDAAKRFTRTNVFIAGPTP